MIQDAISVSEQLYEGAVKNILDTVRYADEKYDTIAIVCHNPAITDFVNRYSNARVDNVPTTGAARIEFDVMHWAEVSNPGKLKWFLYPKALRSA
jgi:phosphohistidine phosphatase